MQPIMFKDLVSRLRNLPYELVRFHLIVQLSALLSFRYVSILSPEK